MALFQNFYRPTEGRVLAGVCAGISRSLEIDVKIVRIVMVLAVLVGATGLWAYPLLWLVMPDEGAGKAAVDELLTQAKQWNDNRTSSAPSAAEPQWRPEGTTPQQPMSEAPKNPFES